MVFSEITNNSDRIVGDLPSFSSLHNRPRIHYVAALCHISQDQRKPKLRYKDVLILVSDPPSCQFVCCL